MTGNEYSPISRPPKSPAAKVKAAAISAALIAGAALGGGACRDEATPAARDREEHDGGQATSSVTSEHETGVMERRSGADAVAFLGDRLPAVAADHGMTADELRDRLLGDRTLSVWGESTLVYTEPLPPSRTAPDGPAPTTTELGHGR